MVLQALTRYYDILADDPESGIALKGYCRTNISFALNISKTGELLDIFPLVQKVIRGKKEVEAPVSMIVPERVIRSSGISANFLCDSCAYVLGLSDKEAKGPDYARKRFEAFQTTNKGILSNTDCDESRAIIAFLDTYEPDRARENPIIQRHMEELLKGGNIVFKLEGSKGYIHEVAEIRKAWERSNADSTDAIMGQCLVTGKVAPIAILHPKLKGIKDANPTGASLVGFNSRAYESYNRLNEQGLNAPVSEKAAFAYTTVLNHLLLPDALTRKLNFGDTTVVYWAESPEKIYAEVFQSLFNPEIELEEIIDPGGEDLSPENKTPEDKKIVRDVKAEKILQEIGSKLKQGNPMDFSRLKDILDPDTRFYVLGLSPNAGRTSVRFFHQDAFSKIVTKLMMHFQDFEIEREFDNQPSMIPLWQILGETVSKKASDKSASPLLAGAMMRSILDGSPYPATLYYATINRIRSDVDDSKRRIKKINYVRAAIIKAYLTRKYHRQANPINQEVLCMSLNEQSKNQAYLLGRLFAVLEKAQKDAVPNLNSTIKDRYFTSACANPATVFPMLIKLSQHHISKAQYGYVNDRKMEEILGLLDVLKNPFPTHLNLDEQGIFVLGYYHQRPALYKSKAERTALESSETESL
jgi:CRISPR-associated protein Csd1